MTEAQFRVAASELFREMGMEDSPDSLDFFQKNAENGSSSEWKKCLKSPSTRVARRVSSDGTALVHLRKKYSTGLVTDQGQTTRSIKASDIEVSPVHGRSRKFSPSLKQKSRFGYVSSTAKVADAAAVSKDSSDSKPATCYSPEEPSKAKNMFKVKKGHGKASSVAAPVVGSHSIKGVGASKLPTSVSAGNISAVRPFGKSASNGAIPTRNGDYSPTTATTNSDDSKPSNNNSGFTSAAKRDQSNRSPSSCGSQSSIPRPGSMPTHNRSGSHGSAVPFAASSYKKEVTGVPMTTMDANKKARSISVIHNGIDTNKLSGVNMRSLTRTRGVDEISTPERKVSDSSTDKRQSFIPTPAQQGAGGGASAGGGVSAAGGKTITSRNTSNGTNVTSSEGSSGPTVPVRSSSGSNTQVLYSRKPSFKLIPMSSTSHRIMHTVQDGGAPKRLTSRASQPVLTSLSAPSAVATATAGQHSAGGSNNSSIPRPAHGKATKETVVLRHAKETATPQGMDDGPEGRNGYDSLPVKEGRSNETEEKDSTSSGSIQGQAKGEYDRLSPPVQNTQPTSKQGDDPVYDTIQDNERNHDHGVSSKSKTSGSLKLDNHPSMLLKLTSEGRQLTSDRQNHSALNQGGVNGVTAPTSNAGHTSSSRVPTESMKSKVPVFRKLSHENKAEKDTQASRKLSSDKNEFGFQRKSSGGRRMPAQSIPRYTSKSGDTYAVVNKSRTSSQLQQPSSTVTLGASTVEETPPIKADERKRLPRSTTTPSISKNLEGHPAAVSPSFDNHHTHQHTHRPLQASLSDSSTSAARITPISFKAPALSSESVGGDSVQSAVSGASSEQEGRTSKASIEGEKEMEKRGGLVPRGGVAMMASVERRAKLAINWSEQSLDRNMPSMITNAVEALGNLVEAAISSPPANSSEDGR